MSQASQWSEASRGPTFEGKVAIVTGAGGTGELPGTGVAIAYTLALRGARVAVVDIDRSRAEDTCQRIVATGGQAEAVLGDLTKFEDCDRMVSEVLARWGQVDVLVNNAGIFPPRKVEKDDPNGVWTKVLAINLTAPRNMTVRVAPHMADRGGGAIVNIVSMAAVQSSNSLSYGASKGGLVALTRATALNYGMEKIRANAIAPGYVDTPMASSPLEGFDEIRARATMLGTRGTAWDVANAAAFLASDDARWITGVTLSVDAGSSAMSPLAMHTRPSPVPEEER